MGFWEIIWMLSILFAVISFTVLSISVLYKGYGEVKEMLFALDDEHQANKKEENNNENK
jgi:hypothetical protein